MTTDATDTLPADPPLGLSLHDQLGPPLEAIAHQAGFAPGVDLAALKRAIEAAQSVARAAERERCAKVCEERFSDGALEIADAIRKGPNRGNTA